MKHRWKTYIILTVIIIGCKVMGFLRESILAFFFGASGAVDSFKLAESLSSVLLGWIIAFSVAFVPIYSEVRTNGGVDKAKKYTHQIVLFVGLCASFFVLIAFFTSRWITAVGAPGFSSDNRQLTEVMYRICIFAYLISAQVSILNNFLNCNDKYYSAGISTLFISFTQIVFIVAAYYLKNPIIMAYGLPASMLARYIFLRIQSHIGIADLCREYNMFPVSEDIRSTIKIAFPLFLSEIVISANELIDNMFASFLTEGSVSVLSYANILSASFHTLITGSILTVFFTAISKNIAEKDKESELNELNYTVDLLAMILIPFSIMAVAFSRWGINLVYERGAFTADTTIKTAIAFSIYILGIPAISLRNMTVRFFQAYKKTNIPLILSAINISINILLNLLLIKKLAYIGLALATTVSYYIIFPIEIYLIKKMRPEFELKKRSLRCVLLLVVSVVIGLLIYFVQYKLNPFYFEQTFVVRAVLFVVLLGFTLLVFCFIASKMKLIDLSAIKSRFFKKSEN